MRNKFVHNIRSSAFQFIINQGAGLLIFYILSAYLDKEQFGEINWTLAVYLASFNILALGIDQVIVQRVAGGNPLPGLSGIYLFHVLTAGLLFYGIILLCTVLFAPFFEQHYLLLILGLGKLLLFFSTPFKQIVTGLEKFSVLLYMSVVSNTVKLLTLTVLVILHQLHLQSILIVFVLADALEFLISGWLYINMKSATGLSRFSSKDYFSLLRSSWPQAAVAVFSAALSRMDWILIGIFLTVNRIGEYSFAYKVFEFSTLPLLVIAPLLVPMFSRYYKEGKKLAGNTRVLLLLKLELLVAGLTALVLNIIWVPVVDALTAGKYGKVNAVTIFLLSLSIPVLYLNNFLWSIHFSQGRMKMILKIFAGTFIANLVLNTLLIPSRGNEGAALAFVISVLLQTVLYAVHLKEDIQPGWRSLAVCSFAALCSGCIMKTLFTSIWLILPLAVLFYFILIILTRQLKAHDWKLLRQPLGREGRI